MQYCLCILVLGAYGINEDYGFEKRWCEKVVGDYYMDTAIPELPKYNFDIMQHNLNIMHIVLSEVPIYVHVVLMLFCSPALISIMVLTVWYKFGIPHSRIQQRKVRRGRSRYNMYQNNTVFKNSNRIFINGFWEWALAKFGQWNTYEEDSTAMCLAILSRIIWEICTLVHTSWVTCMCFSNNVSKNAMATNGNKG